MSRMAPLRAVDVDTTGEFSVLSITDYCYTARYWQTQ